jgi:hypothetical protein
MNPILCFPHLVTDFYCLLYNQGLMKAMNIKAGLGTISLSPSTQFKYKSDKINLLCKHPLVE